jgi:hypothetical protein
LHLLVFHSHINEMHGSRSKIPNKNLVRLRRVEGFNSGIKGLRILPFYLTSPGCFSAFKRNQICVKLVRCNESGRITFSWHIDKYFDRLSLSYFVGYGSSALPLGVIYLALLLATNRYVSKCPQVSNISFHMSNGCLIPSPPGNR